MDLSNIITQVSKPEDKSSSIAESPECNNNNSSSLIKSSYDETLHESLDSKNTSKVLLLSKEDKSEENKMLTSGRLSKDESIKYHKDYHNETEDTPEVVVVSKEPKSRSSHKSASSFLRCFFCCCSRQGSARVTSRKRPAVTSKGSLDHGIPRRHSGVSRESMEDCIEVNSTDHAHTISGSDGGIYVDEDGIHLESGDERDHCLLKELHPNDKGKKCLIIDLDETLVHSSFKPVENADFIVTVEIDNINHQVYVLKRPYVDEFLEKVGPLYECVLFTASLGKYADPVVDLLDKWSVFRHRLFRESCVFHCGNYVKNLDQLGRELNQVLILDNSPASFLFHPQHAIHISSWFDDPDDTALHELIPYLTELAHTKTPVPDFLQDQPAPGTVSKLLPQLSIHNNYVED